MAWRRSLLLALSTWTLALGQVSVQVVPAASVVPAGKRLDFRAVVRGTAQQGCAWSLPDGEGELTGQGVFTAPALAESKILRVRATSAADRKVSGEATVLVLRADPGLANMWEMVAKTQGTELWRPFRVDGLPFLDGATGLRYVPGAEVVPGPGLPSPVRRQWLGYGLSVPVRWDPRLADADGLLLSVREDGNLLRFNATGQPSQVVQLTGKVQDAGLELLRWRGPGWESSKLPLKIQVRGMVPFAGSPDVEGHADGPGLQARFRKPWGLAMLGCAGNGTLTCAVADAEDHVIRALAPDGGTRTLCGLPGAPAFVDGAGGQARFNGPTFLGARVMLHDHGNLAFSRIFVVADTGNHAIRRVSEAGEVTTLAGDGTPGYVDSADPRTARFNRPLGLAVDDDGAIYVADAGNHVIRKIEPRGRVTTLAGAGRPGHQDGVAAEALFGDLKGLALLGSVLCAVDGHAIRTISTLRGWTWVETLVGAPEDQGHEVGGVIDVDRAVGSAFNRPCGLAAWRGMLLVADEGNHAVRLIHQDDLYFDHWCRTLAGDPAEGALRWGLLRDGLPWKPGPAYAALEAPRGVVFSGTGEAYVSTGSCLVQLSGVDAVPPPSLLRAERDPEDGEEATVRVGQPQPLRSLGPWTLVKGEKPLRLWLDTLDRDSGAPYAPTAEFDATHREATVVFNRPGRVETRLTLLTESGFTLGFRRYFRVSE